MIAPDVLVTIAIGVGFCLVLVIYDWVKSELQKDRIHPAE